ncbi:MAG: glutamine-hydrolyzing carbamoyl-phosphate synthase small subunit [bacterium]|nr:glutamine-hydrolyzing carbamoyl-phosphate synthase small subunit [bacterium]
MKSTLKLNDGSSFYGYSFGAKRSVSGEVVFNTGMMGYPETFTDPSYKGQILVLTFPLIGNYGVPPEEMEDNLLKWFESEQIQISGLIISDYSEKFSHWSAKESLADWLVKHNIPALCGVDTRALTKKLREQGVMLGKIVNQEDVEIEDPNLRNLVADVSCKEKTVYNENGKKRIVLVDCGAKHNIIRCLIKRGACVIRVPWDYDFSKEKFDGLFLSNGPGDPKMCKETIENVKKAMEKGIPTMGICLGNQILALAAGADTYKLKYGHRSQNQPCAEKGTKRCYITSQNHGFAVDTKTLPDDWEEWFVNANDKTNEGIKHKTKPFMSVQFHPEARCGPVDTDFLFDRFLEVLK